jgi:hypothetical protein
MLTGVIIQGILLILGPGCDFGAHPANEFNGFQLNSLSNREIAIAKNARKHVSKLIGLQACR